MEFRHRDYAAERESHALPRSRADHHPLSASLTPSPFNQIVLVKNESDDFFDPLRGREPAGDAPDAGDAAGGGQAPARDWNSFKRFLMQKFPVSRMISVSSISDVIIKGGKGTVFEKSPRSGRSGEVEDLEEASREENNVITRQEYVSRLHELKDEINRAWIAEDRVTALKLSIKVAKLLMDTSVLQFYPMLFVLATEVLDKLGELVWNRIRQKAEYSEHGTFLGSLSDDFQASDICSDAKETCHNWFCKVGAIRELLPRIYIELAILPCWRFLCDQPIQNVERLVRMTRGIADPLASGYCRLYIVHCARKSRGTDIGYQITCINDINILLAQILSGNATSSSPFFEKTTLLISLVEPTIEYIMKCIFEDASKREMDTLFVEIGLGRNQVDRLGGSRCLSVILHHMLKEFPSSVINMNAVEILHLIKCSDDTSFDQCLNYRLLGFRICESKPAVDVVNAFVDEVMEVVEQYERLDQYLKVVDAYMDVILQHQMDKHLNTSLEGLLKRAANKEIKEYELESLQSILTKLLSCLKNLDDVFALSQFFEIFDLLHGNARAVVSTHVLEIATRNDYVKDPAVIGLLFEIAQLLYGSVEIAGVKYDDNQHRMRLISRFIQMVDYGEDLELHLTFLVESRGAFGSINELKETLVHSSNRLAVKALNDGETNITLVKSCVTFSEVTIPSISDQARQLDLYLETAEVALLSGLISYVEGLLHSAISRLENANFFDGYPREVDGLVSSLQKLCSLLIIVPGDFNRGVARSILSLVDAHSWMSPRMKTKMLCATILLLAALSQDNLPYHPCALDIMGNDRLFFGDSAYMEELVSLSDTALENLLKYIEQEPSKTSRGSIALEACNCIASSFRVSQDILEICWKLIENARSCLSSNDKFLRSTIKYLDEQLASSSRNPAAAAVRHLLHGKWCS